MKWLLVFFCVFLFLTLSVYCKEVVVDCSDTEFDTIVASIEKGDTVTASNVTYERGGMILEKLGYIVVKDSDGRKIINKTGYCNFYLYIRKNGITEVIYK